jgi:hypothetical protein
MPFGPMSLLVPRFKSSKGIQKVVADIVEDMQGAGETVPNPIGGRWAQKNIDIEHTKDYTLFITRRYTNAKY